MVRSGTTYFRDLLSKNPHLSVYGEIFYPDFFDWGWYSYLKTKIGTRPGALFPGVQREVFLEYLEFLRAKGGSKPVIVDLKLEQIVNIPTISQAIYSKPSRFSFIVLRRNNLLKQVVSEKIMYARIEKGDTTIHRDYVPKIETVSLNVKETINRMRWNATKAQEYRASVNASGAPVIDIVYEDLLGASREKILQEVQTFLGVEALTLSATLTKQNPQPLSELVLNYEDLARAIRHTEFSYCLNLPE
jgi:hypothetical protein